MYIKNFFEFKNLFLMVADHFAIYREFCQLRASKYYVTPLDCIFRVSAGEGGINVYSFHRILINVLSVSNSAEEFIANVNKHAAKKALNAFIKNLVKMHTQDLVTVKSNFLPFLQVNLLLQLKNFFVDSFTFADEYKVFCQLQEYKDAASSLKETFSAMASCLDLDAFSLQQKFVEVLKQEVDSKSLQKKLNEYGISIILDTFGQQLIDGAFIKIHNMAKGFEAFYKSVNFFQYRDGFVKPYAAFSWFAHAGQAFASSATADSTFSAKALIAQIEKTVPFGLRGDNSQTEPHIWGLIGP